MMTLARSRFLYALFVSMGIALLPCSMYAASPSLPSTVQDNKPPVASAGKDQIVHPQDLTILDAGVSSDPEGGQLTYEWKQLAGTTVTLTSSRISGPSFSAPDARDSLVLLVTVQDEQGASAIDFVTVGVVPDVPESSTASTTSVPLFITVAPTKIPVAQISDWHILWPYALSVGASIISFLAVVFALASLGERLAYISRSRESPCGRVLHYMTGSPMGGVQVMMYDADGKLKSTETTNEQGEFPSLFPAGEYGLVLNASDVEIASEISSALQQEGSVVYTGGTFTVTDGALPLDLIIPAKPLHQEVGTARIRLLTLWQQLQFINRTVSWHVLVLGLLLMTAMVFLLPSIIVYIGEIFYVLYGGLKIFLGGPKKIAYGVVEDAVTRAAIDLAVIRLFEQDTHRLVMTRITDSQGKFSVLPSPGAYSLTATKQGYEVFTQEGIHITAKNASGLQMAISLTPLAN